jgi:DNA-binding GntR family transcriptional regulator
MRDPANSEIRELIDAFDVMAAGSRTLQVEVYERMCGALMDGRLRPGQRLSIRNLATAMNTSPMPVREAVKRLAAIHVLELNPGRVITVARLTAQEHGEIRDIRIALEGLAGRHAAQRISTREIAALTRLAQEMHRQWESTTDIARMLRANKEFHFRIYQAAERPVLVTMIKSLWIRVAPFFYEICRNKGHVDFSIEQHLEIVEALHRRDPDGVAEGIAADIGRAADQLMKHASSSDTVSTRSERLPREGSTHATVSENLRSGLAPIDRGRALRRGQNRIDKRGAAASKL